MKSFHRQRDSPPEESNGMKEDFEKCRFVCNLKEQKKHAHMREVFFLREVEDLVHLAGQALVRAMAQVPKVYTIELLK